MAELEGLAIFRYDLYAAPFPSGTSSGGCSVCVRWGGRLLSGASTGDVASADVSMLNSPNIHTGTQSWLAQPLPFLQAGRRLFCSATSSHLPSFSDVRDGGYLTQFISCVRVGCFY